MNEVDEKVLRFEGIWWRYAGSKEQAVRDHMGMSAVEYHQRANRLLDNPVALVGGAAGGVSVAADQGGAADRTPHRPLKSVGIHNPVHNSP